MTSSFWRNIFTSDFQKATDEMNSHPEPTLLQKANYCSTKSPDKCFSWGGPVDLLQGLDLKCKINFKNVKIHRNSVLLSQNDKLTINVTELQNGPFYLWSIVLCLLLYHWWTVLHKKRDMTRAWSEHGFDTLAIKASLFLALISAGGHLWLIFP